MVDQIETAASAERAAGYRPKHRYRRVECDWLEAEEGAEKLWAEIRSDLSFGAISELPFGGDHTYQEAWPIIAPWVRAWNCLGEDATTGEWRPVPPPAEIGVDAFKYIDPLITNWLLFECKMTYQRVIADPKASAPSAPTPTPSSEAGSGS